MSPHDTERREAHAGEHEAEQRPRPQPGGYTSPAETHHTGFTFSAGSFDEAAPDFSQLPTAKVAVPAPAAPASNGAGNGGAPHPAAYPIQPTDLTDFDTQRIPAAPPASNAALAQNVPVRATQPPARPPEKAIASVTQPWRRGPRALIMSLVVATLLLLVAALPLLRALQPSPASRAGAAPTATPTTAPTPTATGPGIGDPNAYAWLSAVNSFADRAYVNNILDNMSLDEKLGQMIQVSFYNEAKPQQWELDEIARDHIGSVILYAANLSSADSARQWTSALQSAATIPLLLGTDEEGGGVNRLASIYGDIPSAWQIAARNDPSYARQVGRQVAQDMYALGMNSDYAPVVDVDSGVGAAGGELNGRMFGNNPDQVTKLAGAFLQGLQDGHHVVGSLKHFPGLGDTATDPHQKLYTLNRSLADLWKIDWAPYTALIGAGQVDMIMSTHVVVAAVDPTRPASLSRPVITGILRQQMHYDGVIITDAVYMLQVQGTYTYDESIVDAILAGNDIVSAATSASAADEALRVLHQAVVSGQISQQQIDDSVRRILLLKLKYGLLAGPNK